MSGPGISWMTVENALQAWPVAGSGLPGASVIWATQNGPRPAVPFIDLRVTIFQQVGVDWLEYADKPLSFSPLTVTAVSTGAGTLTIPNHGRGNGDGPIQLTSSGSLPGGVAAATNYWLIVVDANTVQLSPTFLGTWPTTTPLTLTSAGSGTIQVVSVVGATPSTTTHQAGQELVQRSRGARRGRLTIQAFAVTPTGPVSMNPAALLLDGVISALPSQAAALRAAGVGVLSFGPVRSADGVISSTIFEPRAILEVNFNLASEVDATDTWIDRAVVTPTLDGVQKPTITEVFP